MTVLAASTLVWGAFGWRYSGIIANKDSEIATLQGQIARYRVAIGIDPATPSALLQLTNKELQSKAETIVGRLRGLFLTYTTQLADIRALPGLDDQARRQRKEAVERDLDQQYITNLRSDAYNVDFELRRRLGPAAVAGIIGISPSVVAADGTRINILQLTTAVNFPAFDLGFLSVLADGIQQMARLLPDGQ
ncbi:MAG TPA: hypothetical protein VGU20_16835 [Stellaceae bacterium]|nr:hypothetical protein [Stellaceae bacterium]